MNLECIQYKNRILYDFNEQGHNWNEFCVYLNLLLDEKNIDDPLARELAQQIFKHPDKLTSKEWEYFYTNGLGEHYYVAKCAISNHDVTWEDMDFAFENGDECKYCLDKQNE